MPDGSLDETRRRLADLTGKKAPTSTELLREESERQRIERITDRKAKAAGSRFGGGGFLFAFRTGSENRSRAVCQWLPKTQVRWTNIVNRQFSDRFP